MTVTMGSRGSGGSTLLLEEYFSSGSEAFLSELNKVMDPKKLAALADRWKIDPRPWARQQILNYLAAPLGVPGHNVVVKRLFKHAEKQRDSELMGAFLHAFDCLVRHKRRMAYRWDQASRQSWQEEELFAPRDQLLPAKLQTAINPRTGERIQIPIGRTPKDGRLFSYRTRYYLRRRVSRYFRLLGYRSPAEYLTAAVEALAWYSDKDLAKGEHILDSWSLLYMCYRKHPALTFTPSKVRLNEGRSLNELSPAPRIAKAWTLPAAADALFGLLSNAESRLVRVWAIELLKRHHASYIAAIGPGQLLPLFDSFDSDLQQFAVQLLEQMPGLATLPIELWLQLLKARDPAAQASICSLMVRHVSVERLSLEQTMGLATSLPAPVANLGLLFLRTRVFGASEREVVSDLADARCQAAAAGITQFALSIVGAKGHYDVKLVIRFFDSLIPEMRDAAWTWLTPESAGYDDPSLWSRLLETPYEDIRLRLISALEARRALPGASASKLTPIWSSVLLGIHRGGRHKIKAVHQISRALVERPEYVRQLLPVMAVAIRSVRPSEARVGLAAVVQALEVSPALAAPVAEIFPELQFVSAGATS